MDHFSSDEIYDDFSWRNLIGSGDDEEVESFQVYPTRHELVQVQVERVARARVVPDALPLQLRVGVVEARYFEILKVRDHVHLVRLESHFEVAGSVGVNDKVIAEVAVALGDVLETPEHVVVARL